MALLVDGVGSTWRPYAAPPPPPPPPPPPAPKPKVNAAAGYRPSAATPPRPATAQATSDRPLAGFVGPLKADQEVYRSGVAARPLAEFIGPLAPEQEVLRSGPAALLPRNITEGSQPKSYSTAGLGADDPRAGLITQGQQLQEVDQQAYALGAQPLDLGGAQQKLQADQANLQKFWVDVYGQLTEQQSSQLKGMAKAIDTAPASKQAATEAEFEGALMSLLTSDQRTQLRTFERKVEDSQLHLQGQQIGQRLQQAQLDSGFCGDTRQKAAAEARVEAVMVDARVQVMNVRQVAIQRKVQDANTLLLTPENQRKLAPTQAQVLEAAERLRLNPSSEQAQQQLNNAQLAHDALLTGSINTADKRALDMLIATAEREGELGLIVRTEAEAQRIYQNMQAAASRGPLNSSEQQIMSLAEANLGLMKATRSARELGAAAANSTDSDRRQELLEKLDGSMLELKRRTSDVDIRQAEIHRDVAVHNEQATGAAPPAADSANNSQAGKMTLVASTSSVDAPGKTQQPLTVAPEFAMALPPTQLTAKAANEQLDGLRQARTEFEDKLSADKSAQKRSSWFEIVVGGLETIGGGVMVATGVGAGFGVALMAHGAYKLSHGIHDLATGKSTDSWVSQGMQAMGASKGVANAGSFVFDVGMTAGAGAIGTYFAIVRSATVGTKLFGAASGTMMADGWQAGARTALDGLSDPSAHHIPLVTQGLMKTGMSEQAASEVQLLVSTAAPFGVPMARIASSKAPTLQQGFKTVNGAAMNAAPAAGQPAMAAAGKTPTVQTATTAQTAQSPTTPAQSSSAQTATSAQTTTSQPATSQAATSQPATSNTASPAPAAPAAQTTSSTSAAADTAFTYDFYGRKAPADVREEAAALLTRDRDGDPDKLAREMKRRPLVVERDDSNKIVGAAVLEPNWRGHFGRNSVGEKVGDGTTAIRHLNGDDGGVRTATAAIEATSRFVPNQRAVVWNSDTLAPGLSKQVTDAKAGAPILKRDAPELLAEQGPQLESVHRAMYDENGTALRLPEQLRNLNEIPVEKRGGWPEAAHHTTYKAAVAPQPVTFLGSEGLGRIFHPIKNKDSWVTWVNTNVHPTKWTVDAYKALKARVAAPANSSPAMDPLFQMNGSRGAMRNAWDDFSASTSIYARHAKDSLARGGQVLKDGVRIGWSEVKATGAYWGGHAKDLFHSIHSPVTTPVSRAGSWANQHFNPYALQGIEASPARAALQNGGYALRYGIDTGISVARRVLVATTVPQAATGNMDIVVDDNRYLTPWNVSTGNIGRHSIAVDFPLTGVRFGAWVGGPLDVRKPYIPGVDAPFTDAENGSMPLARYGAAPTDPNGPKAMRFLTMFRSMAADAGVAMKVGVPNFYVTTSATVKIGTGALSFSGSVPTEPGAQKGLSTLGAFTSIFPNVASSVFVGPAGSVKVSRQTMPAFSLDSTPISAGARDRALAAGKHYTVGTEKPGSATGDFYLLNPSWGKVDPSTARREEMWHNLNLFNWFG